MHSAPHGPGSFWLWVMCLTGVDYFSTLGYQPSIAFEATGALAPIATLVLVAVTLFGALPIYSHVAGESFRGQGSIAMLERLLHGWKGKFLVLVLLGFAATDFVITKTLSAADAAVHLIENPAWSAAPDWLQGHQGQMVLTMSLLVALGAMFLRGFREVIGLAVFLVALFLTLNLIVVVSGLWHLATHDELFRAWYERVAAGDWHLEHRPIGGTGWLPVIAVSFILFPKLALGLSGFETGVAVMPLVKGDDDDDPHKPLGRIRNARKLLLTAAAIMSFFLLASALCTAMLVPPADLEPGGKAFERSLAYLAHAQGPHELNPLFGEAFGTLYDVSTVLILWFAGASAMSGLLNLVPQYLPSYGMAPEWARAIRPLVILFTVINLFVTWVFDASVSKQGGAYATGVMALLFAACVASVIDVYRKRDGAWARRTPWGYVLIAAVFLYTFVAIVIEKPDGMKIAGCFIAAIVVSSMTSRVMRSTELRFSGFTFANDQSRFLWDSMKHIEFPILVPHRPGRRPLDSKEEDIRRVHRLDADVPIVYIEASVGDPSEFLHFPQMEVLESHGRFVIRVTRSHSIAHVIAAVSLELSKVGKPPEIHFGWSDENPLAANLRFVLFGEGNVPWMVRELIRKAEPDDARRPRIVIG
ncbi:MAG: amino acid transporter [Planctomycetota bacterium]|nr:MAG: amino acid transporter [Planctomycetota bacterium]